MAAPSHQALTEATSTPSEHLALEVHEVVMRWPGRTEPVLAGVSLDQPGGSSVWIGGANGAGKTTLLRIVVGLVEATGGRVRVAGSELATDRVAYQRSIGFLSAGNSGLYARMTVRQHLDYWAAIAFIPRPRRPEAIDRMLRDFALTELGSSRVDRLSMGQRQRLRLALTFLADPRLILLDEPRTSLDADGSARLAAAVDRALATGAAVVWCSPDPDELVLTVDRRLTLAGGQLSPS